MALDELHARRLATLFNVVEDALDRIDVVLRGTESGSETAPVAAQLTAQRIHRIRTGMEQIRGKLREAAERFSVQPQRPEPRQLLAAELSRLWVVLENAKPKRMKGYGTEFDPADRVDWDAFIHDLLRHVEQIRQIALPKPIKR